MIEFKTMKEQRDTLTAALRRLIERWREEATRLDNSNGRIEDEYEREGKAEGFTECADELTAVLRAASEGAE